MYLYTVNSSSLLNEEIIDNYESLIWTERWQEPGDFELNINATPRNQGLLVFGRFLGIAESRRLMVVESVKRKIDREGKDVLEVRGRSLEHVLMNRIAKRNLSSIDSDPFWPLSGTPAAIARAIWNTCLRDGAPHANDAITPLTTTSPYPASNISEPGDTVSVELKLTTVYEAIRSMIVPWDLGMRLVVNRNNNLLNFNIFAGNDRTPSVAQQNAVIFSQELDTFQVDNELQEFKDAKSAVYVFPSGGTSSFLYFSRHFRSLGASLNNFATHRVLGLEVPFQPGGYSSRTTQLYKAARDALIANKEARLIDGVVNQKSPYIYDLNYYLGDRVQIRGLEGETYTRRVSEYIFVSDQEGVRSFPTFSEEVSPMSSA